MELVVGRPENVEERSQAEILCYDMLDHLGMKYWRADHEAIYTMEGAKEIDRCLNAVVCKNLFLCNKQKTNFYLLMIPGEKKFKTAEVSKKLGSTRLEFAPAEKMEEFLHLQPGSVSIMGLLHDKEHHVQLVMDKNLLEGEFIGCHPCVNTSSLKLVTADLFEKFLPAIGHEPIMIEISE